MKYIDSTLPAEIVSRFSCIPAILAHLLPAISDVKALHLNGKHAGSALETQATVTANHFINVGIECESDCVAVARAYVFHGRSNKNLCCDNKLDFNSAYFEIHLPSQVWFERLLLVTCEFASSLAPWVCSCYIEAPKTKTPRKGH